MNRNELFKLICLLKAIIAQYSSPIIGRIDRNNRVVQFISTALRKSIENNSKTDLVLKNKPAIELLKQLLYIRVQIAAACAK